VVSTSRMLLEKYTFPETETYAVVQIINEIGFESVKPHFETVCEGRQVRFLSGTEEFFRKGEFFEVCSEGING